MTQPNDKTTHLGQILASAFTEDPWIQHLFQNNRHQSVKFFTFLASYVPLAGGQTIVYPRDTIPKGVALVENPKPHPRRLLHPGTFSMSARAFFQSVTYIFSLPPRQRKHLNQYVKITSAARPKTPHHYLICIGVSPEAKGQGIGKDLLTQIHAIVDQDPDTSGIGLDTENHENLPLYQHFGYTLTSTSNLDNLTIYSMFRQKQTT